MDDLSFEADETESGKSKHPYAVTLRALHPEYGEVGTLKYWRGSRSNSPILINHLDVPEEHRGNGYAGALMDELQRRHPKSSIDHGDRTDAGKAWWTSYTRGKTVRRGRTIEAGLGRTSASSGASKRKKPKTKRPQKCRWCSRPAVRSYLWAEGMAYIPTCRRHEQQTQDHIAAQGDDVAAVHEIEGSDEADSGSAGSTVTAAANDVDSQAAAKGHGAEWRSGLGEDDEAMMQRWEDSPANIQPHERARFRKLVSGAPPVEGPVYRGVDFPGTYGWKDKIEKKVQKDTTINIPRWSSATTRPEVAGGFGTVVYEIHGHGGARGIGNTLHEAVMPPGKFTVHSAEWRKMPVRANIDGRTTFESDRLHVVLHPHPGNKEAARKHWVPTKRLFGPTQGLDVRLFDGEKLKPDVREYILSTLDKFWAPQFGHDWKDWAIVYFAGSEASEWTSDALVGNNDFDVLIGVDYDAMRRAVPSMAQLDNQQITNALNLNLRVLDAQTDEAMIPIEGKEEGPFSNTWYVNANSYDIRNIKPYAAYDVTHDRWAVKPPHLPKWDISKFPEGPALVREAEAVAAQVRAILEMPEPYRTQQGFTLWQRLHGDRSRAFGPQGEGWYDPGNVIEKWLDQEGLWERLVEIMLRARERPESLSAPADWSNDPA